MARGRKTGGRQKGSRNKVYAEVREMARGLVDDPAYRAALTARLEAGTAGTMEVTLWAYAYGRVPLPSSEDGATFPAIITITF